MVLVVDRARRLPSPPLRASPLERTKSRFGFRSHHHAAAAFPLPPEAAVLSVRTNRGTLTGHPGNAMETTGCNQAKNAVRASNAAMRQIRMAMRFRRLDEARCNGSVTPVTPEVAGSSPVAPVFEMPANGGIRRLVIGLGNDHAGGLAQHFQYVGYLEVSG